MARETSPDILRSLGRIEGNQEQMNERMREQTGWLNRMETRLDRMEMRLDRMETRLDWLIFALLGAVATIIAGLIVIIIKLFLGA